MNKPEFTFIATIGAILGIVFAKYVSIPILAMLVLASLYFKTRANNFAVLKHDALATGLFIGVLFNYFICYLVDKLLNI